MRERARSYFTRWRDPRPKHDNSWHETEWSKLSACVEAYNQDRAYFFDYIEIEMGTITRVVRVKAKGKASQ